MRCGDPNYEKQIDSKVDQLIETLPKLQDCTDEIQLTFYIQSSSSGIFGQSSRNREQWEQWVIPFKLKDVKRESG